MLLNSEAIERRIKVIKDRERHSPPPFDFVEGIRRFLVGYKIKRGKPQQPVLSYRRTRAAGEL